MSYSHLYFLYLPRRTRSAATASSTSPSPSPPSAPTPSPTTRRHSVIAIQIKIKIFFRKLVLSLDAFFLVGDALGTALLDAAADVRTAARAAFGAFESRFPALASRQRDKLPPAARRLLGNSPPGTGAGRPPARRPAAEARAHAARARPWRSRGASPATGGGGRSGVGAKLPEPRPDGGFAFDVQIYEAKRPSGHNSASNSPRSDGQDRHVSTDSDVHVYEPRRHPRNLITNYYHCW